MLSEAQVHNLRHASTTQNLVASGFAPTIPSPFKAAAIFATVTTFVTDRNDHYIVSMGRDATRADIGPNDLYAYEDLDAPALPQNSNKGLTATTTTLRSRTMSVAVFVCCSLTLFQGDSSGLDFCKAVHLSSCHSRVPQTDALSAHRSSLSSRTAPTLFAPTKAKTAPRKLPSSRPRVFPRLSC
jgi:hypothetical protein